MKKHLSRNGVIIFGAAATALLAGGYFSWWREPEHANAARQRARHLKVAEFDVHEITGPVHAYQENDLLVRTTSPSSNQLLFRARKGNVVLVYDADIGSLLRVPSDAWDAASGNITEEDQELSRDGRWVYDGTEGRLKRDGVPAQTRAKNHLQAVSSPAGDKIAVISADGRFTPGTYGLIFGGSPRHASGRHYLEVILASNGRLLVEPTAIPVRKNWRYRYASPFWTADERFIICRTDTTKYCVIPTGLGQ